MEIIQLHRRISNALYGIPRTMPPPVLRPLPIPARIRQGAVGDTFTIKAFVEDDLRCLQDSEGSVIRLPHGAVVDTPVGRGVVERCLYVWADVIRLEGRLHLISWLDPGDAVKVISIPASMEVARVTPPIQVQETSVRPSTVPPDWLTPAEILGAVLSFVLAVAELPARRHGR